MGGMDSDCQTVCHSYLVSVGNQTEKKHSQGWTVRGNRPAQEKGDKDL